MAYPTSGWDNYQTGPRSVGVFGGIRAPLNAGDTAAINALGIKPGSTPDKVLSNYLEDFNTVTGEREILTRQEWQKIQKEIKTDPVRVEDPFSERGA